MKRERNASRLPRCPRCRSQDLELLEYRPASPQRWTQRGNQLRHEGAVRPASTAKVVSGVCLKCEHHWVLRNFEMAEHPLRQGGRE